MGKLPREPEVGARFAEVAAKLGPADLAAGDEEDDLAAALRGDPRLLPQRRFLGFYSEAGLRRALDAYGLLDELARRGYPAPRIRVDARDPARQAVRVLADDEGEVLAELVAREGSFVVDDPEAHEWPGRGRVFAMLVVEWLTLRDPRATFTAERPRLPGQTAPGLGLGPQVLELLVQASRRLGKDGVLEFPDHYHNAVLYGRRFRYASPELEGRVRAIARDAAGMPLADVSWAIDAGALVDGRTSERVPWTRFRGEQVLAVSPLLASWFDRPEYARRVARSLAAASWRLDPAPAAAGERQRTT